MPSRSSHVCSSPLHVITALLVTAALCVPTASAFYMPQRFDSVSDAQLSRFPAFNETVSGDEFEFAGNGTAVSESEQETGGDEGAGLAARDVWTPKLYSPTHSTVWHVGATVQVTWDGKSYPKQVTNWIGQLVLGHLTFGDVYDEHLDYEHPLVAGFNLSQGHASFTVPDVPFSRQYIVVLFGDSGNRSPPFTIVGGSFLGVGL